MGVSLGMNPLISFIVSILTGIAALVTILGWFEVKPRNLFKREWWDSVRSVTITRGRLLTIMGLELISFLGSYGFYISERQVPFPKIVQWGLTLLRRKSVHSVNTFSGLPKQGRVEA